MNRHWTINSVPGAPIAPDPATAEASAVSSSRLTASTGAPESSAGAPARLEFREMTRETAARINAEPADATKAEVEVNGWRITLYLVCGPDGRERWVSEPVSPEPSFSGARTCARAGWQGTAYRVAVRDGDGSAVALGTIPARHRRHAENRAAKLGAKVW